MSLTASPMDRVEYEGRAPDLATTICGGSMKHGLMLMLAVLIPSRSIAEDAGRAMPARADPIAAAQTATMRDEPGQSFRDCADCPEMVVVPAGSFMMGSPDDEPGGFFDGERPLRRVSVRQ